MGEFVSFYCGNNGSGNSKRCAAITQADETWVMSSLTHSGAIGLQNLDVYVFVVDPAIEEYAAGIYGKQQMGTTYCSYHATFQEKYSGKWLNYVVVQPNSNSNCMFNLKGIDTANGAELDTMMFNLAHEM